MTNLALNPITAASDRVAEMPDNYESAGGPAWISDPAIAFEGVFTGDKRIFERGSLTWRELPLPFSWQKAQSPGHFTAVVVGRIETLEVTDDGLLRATGHFLDTPDAKDYVRLVETGAQIGVSVDLGEVEYEDTILAVDEEGWPTDWETRFTKAELAGVTGVQTPAFADARIKLDNGTQAITAAAPVKPPKAWFDDPQLDGPTPLTVTPDGRIFGHIATFGTCHIGYQNTCVTAPKNYSDYKHFHLGKIETESGEMIDVGMLTMNTGHAGIKLGPAETTAHYDNTGMAAAFVRAGEDRWGIWVSGSVRSELDPAQYQLFRASKPSGDWRTIDGGLELVAVLMVNQPGYPVTRVASGEPLALVAALSPPPCDDCGGDGSDLAATVAELSARLEALEMSQRLADLDKQIADLP